MAHIHHVPGRLRIRIPVLKRNAALASVVERQIAGVTGVTNAEANPLTGSVVILYDPVLTSASGLISAVRANGYHLEESRAEPVRACAGSAVPRVSKNLAKKAAEKVVWYVIETAIERSVPALILALL